MGGALKTCLWAVVVGDVPRGSWCPAESPHDLIDIVLWVLVLIPLSLQALLAPYIESLVW